jgi:hypothetical protein
MTPRGGSGGGRGDGSPPDLTGKKGPVENGRAKSPLKYRRICKGHSLTDSTIKLRAQNAFNALSTALQACAANVLLSSLGVPRGGRPSDLSDSPRAYDQ